MIQHYLLITLRVFRKQKLQFLLNVIGLAVAIACSLLIYIHICHELSYEQDFVKTDRLYRITIDSRYGDTYRHWAVGPVPLGPMLKEIIPEIQESVRLRKINSSIFRYDLPDGSSRQFEEKQGFFVDPGFVDVFDITFIKGDPKTALKDKSGIVLTENLARKYFGSENPIGKTLVDGYSNADMTVTGVIPNPPLNSHIQYNYLLPMDVFIFYGNKEWMESRTWKAVYTYILTSIHESRTIIESKIPQFMRQFFQGEGSDKEIFAARSLHLQPIREIHLHSRLEQEIGPNSDITYIYIFSLTGILLILIAAINFINITTAQSFRRTKEVGIRKTIGATKRELVTQFLGESLLITLFAAAIALIILNTVLPYYNILAGKNIQFTDLINPAHIGLLLGLIGLITLMAGAYPALFISEFQPLSIIQSTHNPRSSVSWLRRALVVFQFVIAIIMIFGSITIFRQLNYFQTKNLGFNKDQLLAIKLYSTMKNQTIDNRHTIKTELQKLAGITHVALASNLPGERFSVEHLKPAHIQDWDQLPTVRFMRTDQDFFDVLNIPIIGGYPFSNTRIDARQFILNQTAVKALGLKNPVGTKAASYFGEGEIIGVIPDFHFASLHHTIEPLVIEYRPSWASYLLIKFHHTSPQIVLQHAKAILDELAPGHLFSYIFMDDQLNQLYHNDHRMNTFFRICSLLAILISCLGLFGLVTLSAELRIKEIGVRKILGASIPQLVIIMTAEFLQWVLIAAVFALPIAYLAMQQWLMTFAYRVNIHLWTFLITTVLSFVLALLTVSWQAIRAATANPAETLRYE
jgi:putative ABC transport system permease protein